MLTSIVVSMLIHCARPMPLPPPPQRIVTVRCEGADQVSRDFNGHELGRWVAAPSCWRPVRLTTHWQYGLSAR